MRIKRFLTANQPATFAVAKSLYDAIPPRPPKAVKEPDIFDDDIFGDDYDDDDDYDDEYSEDSDYEETEEENEGSAKTEDQPQMF